MCGIAGIVSSAKVPSFHSDVSKMLDLILHRGPDGCGIESSDFATIGHVRLSILDASAGASQPFYDDDFILTYNGEIYNYEEIKKQLPATHFKSYSDTEVLFHALKEWGVVETLKKCRGMFAFCWHKRSTGETYLVRDRFGVKPLFYTVNQFGQLVFASELKSVLSYVKCNINDYRILMSPLGGLERDTKRTAWDGLMQVPPGHILQFFEGKHVITRYFDLADYFDQEYYTELENQSWNQLADQLDVLLSNAVKDMGMGDIPAGSFMSGGVDSGLVSYYGKLSNNDIKLFTSDVSGNLSEFKLAEVNAAAIKSPLIKSTYLDDHCLEYVVNATWHYESPLVVHFNALPLSVLSEITRQNGVKAVLTGEGADELFVGYPHLVGASISKLVSAPFEVLNRIYGAVPALNRLLSKSQFGVDYFKALRNGADNSFMIEDLELANEKLGFLNFKSRNQHLLSFQMIKSHLHSLLWRNDRMGMMHSIESRFPFLDERVVQFAVNLPYHYKVASVTRWNSSKHPFKSGKHLLRKVASNYLPKSISHGQKTGFPVNGLLSIKTDNSFFSHGVIQRTLQLDQKGMHAFLNSLSPYFKSLLLMTELWAQLFVDGQSKDFVSSQVATHVRVSP
ncbi:MAG: asparagine synthase (glutamine-hydrolyzing) [Arcticibacter sp.]